MTIWGEGREGETLVRVQEAVGDPGPEAAVDLGPGGVIADGTAFVHLGAVFSFQFSVFGKRIG